MSWLPEAWRACQMPPNTWQKQGIYLFYIIKAIALVNPTSDGL
jgi:hypothetical protein